MKSLVAIILFLSLSISFGHAFEYQTFPSYQKAMRYYLNKHKTKHFMRPDSSVIKLAAYYPKTKRKILLIQMKSTGKLYIYEGIPKLTWFKFTEAKSKGKYYQYYIKGKFPFQLKTKKK